VSEVKMTFHGVRNENNFLGQVNYPPQEVGTP
jgi:hypothetical protein